MWDQFLWEDIKDIYDRKAGTEIEQFFVRRHKCFRVYYTDGGIGQRTFHEMERYFEKINNDIRYGLSDFCKKIEFIPTCAVLYLQEEV